jgi:hypothetical protein
MAVNKLSGLTVHEILTKAGEAPTRVDKVEVLREYNTLALRDVLKGAYDDEVEFILPKGAPPYTSADPKSVPSNLNKQTKRFRYFVKGGPGENLAAVKVEMMFVKVLEAIHPDDAELIIKMKEKDLAGAYKGITKKLVAEAFPGLIVK